MIRRVGSFALDSARRQLTRDGASVHLTPKAFDLLTVLISQAPRVVPKRELHEHLWPNRFVSDATLAGLVKELRRALEDSDAEAPVIRTAHRVGYAFCPNVDHRESPRPSVLHWLVVGGRRIPLDDGENLIGRDASANVWLDLATVSRRHARIVIDGADARLEDSGSKNGTRVGERRVTGLIALRDGDQLRFGLVRGVYRSSSAGMSTETHIGASALHTGATRSPD